MDVEKKINMLLKEGWWISKVDALVDYSGYLLNSPTGMIFQPEKIRDGLCELCSQYEEDCPGTFDEYDKCDGTEHGATFVKEQKEADILYNILINLSENEIKKYVK